MDILSSIKLRMAQATVYDKIDALSDCSKLEELIPKLQSILSDMAYYVINSDGAVLESHEEWHTGFTNRLRSEVGQQARDAKRPPTRPAESDGGLSSRRPRMPRARPKGMPGRGSGGGGSGASGSASGGGGAGGGGDRGTGGSERGGSRADRDDGRRDDSRRDGLGGSLSDSQERGARGCDKSRLEDVPPSLRAIMEGTHASLHQEEEDDGFLSRFGIRSGKGTH
jgi:hypothetical protein